MTFIMEQDSMTILKRKKSIKTMKLIKFGAEWCGPCKAMINVVNKTLLKFPALEFEDLDVEDNINITDEYNVKNLPTFVIVDNDKEIARVSGSMTQSKFESWLESNVKKI